MCEGRSIRIATRFNPELPSLHASLAWSWIISCILRKNLSGSFAALAPMRGTHFLSSQKTLPSISPTQRGGSVIGAPRFRPGAIWCEAVSNP
jgi:hypothetical protein